MYQRCEVVKVLRLAPDLVKVLLDPGPALREAWTKVPGGFVTFHLPTSPRVHRCYSMVSAPEDSYPRVVVREKPGGTGSMFFNRVLKAGMTLDVVPPRTRLFEPWMDAKPRHWLLFGAGIGVTPLLGLARHALTHDHSVSMFLGNRSMGQIPLYKSLDELALHPKVRVRHILSDKSSENPLYSGRIDAEKVISLIEGARQTSAAPPLGFTSGPAVMMREVRKGWESAGLAPELLRSERFDFPPGLPTGTVSTSGMSHAQESTEVHVSLEGSRSHTFSMDQGGETLLSAAMAAGVPMRHSCRGGVCGTCRMTLLDGEVLSDKPLNDNTILCCQSRPKSPVVRLASIAKTR